MLALKPRPSPSQGRGRNRVVSRRAASRPPLDLGLSRLASEQSISRRRPSSSDARDDARASGAPGEEMQGVYIISVAARILAMHPQTLRKYERLGLVRPSRTVGMLRLYSEGDIARLELIKYLVGDLGLNLAGVRMAMRLFNQLLEVRLRMQALQGQALKSFLEESVDEMLATLRASIR